MIFLWLAALLVLHHYAIHPELKGLNRFFQIKDFANPLSHEFFIELALLLSYLRR